MAETLWEEAIDAAQNQEQEQFQSEEEEYKPFSLELNSLLQVGHLSELVKIYGHEVSIRTLKIGEELEAGLLSQRYKDTIEEGRGYIVALVAACVQSVDGLPLITGIGPADETFDRKFHYILNNWHWISIRTIYDHYTQLEERATEAAEELKKG